jgi:hypothetical protein
VSKGERWHVAAFTAGQLRIGNSGGVNRRHRHCRGEIAMGLFKPDLYRSFIIGFLIGTAALGLGAGSVARAEIVAKLAPAMLR